jgi:hypothetical protein
MTFTRELARPERNRVRRHRVHMDNLPQHCYHVGYCPICLEPLVGAVHRFPCGHLVCLECCRDCPNCPVGCQNHVLDHH